VVKHLLCRNKGGFRIIDVAICSKVRNEVVDIISKTLLLVLVLSAPGR
jgi:hypothetical protein